MVVLDVIIGYERERGRMSVMLKVSGGLDGQLLYPILLSSGSLAQT